MGFLIEETRTTPFISIEKGNVIIKGRSIPEDSFEFYDPVIEVCNKYIENPPEYTDINIHLDYVNSGSKKFLTNMLSIFEVSYLQGHNYKVNWHYDIDDESMLDLGHDLKGIIKIPFEIVLSDD